MRKLIMVLLLGLVISGFGVGTASATVTVNGSVDGGEWLDFYFNATDPLDVVNSGGITYTADFLDDYDISRMMIWWDDTTAYIRTDVYGTPTLAPIGSSPYSAFYQYSFDTDGGDNFPNFFVRIEQETASTGDVDGVGGIGNMYLRVYDWNWTPLGFGTASMGSIMEGSFPVSYVNGLYGEPTHMFMELQNQGAPNDDVLPDKGWADRVPEPTSMLLLGMGLIGLAGGRARKKFKA